tara:strand:+ start:1871 stop:3166 length:1296 start_codon:yes stop_codon:yes gene_type:complete
MADILARNPDLTKIINKAVKRIGENHALARDNSGVEMKASEIEKDRIAFRKEGKEEMTKVIEESLKAAANEMAQKLVLENTINGMIKETLQGETVVGNTLKSVGAGFVNKQGSSDTLTKFRKRQEMGEQTTKDGSHTSLEKTTGLKEIGKDIKKFFKWIKKISSTVAIQWADIPESVRQLFLKKHKNNAKFKRCKLGACPGFTALNDKDKKTELVGLEAEDSTEIAESTKGTIKKLVNKKLKDKVNEVKTHPGYDTYEKSVKKSKIENDKAMKDTDKKFKEYNRFEYNENPEFPHQENSKTNADGQFQYYRNDEEDQEFVDDFSHPGLIDFDINNLNLDRLTKYLEGSSETGNAQEDKDGQPLGNVVPSDLGKKMMKSAERRKEKIASEKASMSNLRGYTPDVQKVKQVKEEVSKDMDSMKKLWSYNKNTQ